ncbi:acetyltransferase [Colletotrichum karsti]|uniref:Acetyltransferase n=1 Tax=Colletotrichum karsti TaxID=1095194 RepID=A0A9P6LEF7_9PEZI|nr:acetyltransferase [Colletotrichum karsti]KAF9870373.1 acetyltransferase [Colletotrichum karsti]
MSPKTTSASHLPTTLRSATHPILLRTLSPSDAPAVSAVLSDPDNTRHDPHASAISPEVAVKVVERMRESAGVPSVLDAETGKVVSGPGRVNLVVVYLDTDAEDSDGRVIGFGGFGGINETEGKVRVGDVGVMIDKEFRGRGFAVEAMRLAVEWAFRGVEEGGLQLDRVSATMREENVAMVRLVEGRLGWEGVRRGGEVFFEVTEETWRK